MTSPEVHEGPGGNISAEAVVQQTIEPAIRMIVGTMIHGIAATTRSVPPHIVLNAVCKAVGALSASAIQSPDLAVLLNTRRGFKENFEAGVAEANKQAFAVPAASPGLVKAR